MKDNLFTQMIYRIVLCCVAGLATLLSFGFIHNVYSGMNEQFEFIKGVKDLSFSFLKFYTNWSNWFVFIVSVIVCADTVKRVKAGEKKGYNNKIRCLKFITTVIILVTYIVYNTMLESMFTVKYWRNLYSLVCHVVAPLMFIFDFILFDEHKTVKWYYPLMSAIFPLIYSAVILIIGAAVPGFKYPYFFFEVSRFGYGLIFLMIAGMLVGFVGLGYLMWLYDKLVKVDGKWKLDLPRRAKSHKKDVIKDKRKYKGTPVSDDVKS